MNVDRLGTWKLLAELNMTEDLQIQKLGTLPWYT